MVTEVVGEEPGLRWSLEQVLFRYFEDPEHFAPEKALEAKYVIQTEEFDCFRQTNRKGITIRTREPPAPVSGYAFIYILACSDGAVYAGSAGDVAKRLAEHGGPKGAFPRWQRHPFSISPRQENQQLLPYLKHETKNMKSSNSIGISSENDKFWSYEG